MLIALVVFLVALSLACTLDRRLTNSQLNTAATCLRKHQWSYVAGIRPASEAMPLRMGTAFHSALDRRAMGMPIAENVALLRGEYELRKGPNAEWNTDLEYEAEIVVRLVVGYDWRWAAWDSDMEIVATEQAFEVPITNPETGRDSRTFVFCGKIDKLVKLVCGRMAVMEHKTTSSDLHADGDYWKRLRIDSQIARYVLGARRLGHPIETVLYDVVRKPDTRPRQIPLLDDDGVKIVCDANGERVRTKDGKKWRESGDAAQGFMLQARLESPAEYGERLRVDMGERPDFYFARREIPRTEGDLLEAAHDLWDQAQILNKCATENRWPKNTTACIGFGTCTYFNLCTNSRTPDDEQVPDGFVRVADPHQELIS